MEKAQIKAALVKGGWIEDRYGNFKSPSGKLRVKLQQISIRLEQKIKGAVYESINYTAPDTWGPMRSDYNKNLSLTAEGCLVLKGKVLKLKGVGETETNSNPNQGNIMSNKRIFQASFDHPLNGEVVEVLESGPSGSIVRHCNRLHKVSSRFLYAITAADTSEEDPDTIAASLLKAHGSNNTHAEILSNLESAVCTLLWQAQIALAGAAAAAPDKDAAMNAILEVNSLREQAVQRLQEIQR